MPHFVSTFPGWCGRYAECREKVRELTQDEQFRLLSGETDETLAVGRVVGAKVRKALPMRVQCELESGLMGVVDRTDFSDDPEADITSTVREGTMLTCRIKAVQKSKYLVRMHWTPLYCSVLYCKVLYCL